MFPDDINSTEYLEALQNALDGPIVRHEKMSTPEYMKVYTAVKNYQDYACVEPPAMATMCCNRRLYNWLISYMTKNIRDIKDKALVLSGTALLDFYITQWEYFQTTHMLISSLFLGVNQQWIERQCKQDPNYTCISSTLIQLWFFYLFRHLTTHVMSNVICLVNAERSGRAIDNTLIIRLYKSYVELKPEGVAKCNAEFRERLGAYICYYEIPYINAAVSYIDTKTHSLRTPENMRKYISVLSELFAQEDERSERYLRPNSLTPMRNKLNERFLRSEIGCIYQIADSIFATGNDNKGLCTIYALLSRFDDSDVLRQLLDKFVAQAKNTITRNCPEIQASTDGSMAMFAKSAVIYLADTLNTHLDMVATLFCNNSSFTDGLRHMFAAAVNTDEMHTRLGVKPARLAAEFCNIVLKNSKTRTDNLGSDSTQAAELMLHKAMHVLHASHNKKLFFKFYQLHLTRRLLDNTSMSLDLEKTAIAMIYKTVMMSVKHHENKKASDFDYTLEAAASQNSSEAKQMITDIIVGAENSRNYTDQVSQVGFDVDFKVLRGKTWTSVNSNLNAKVVLPSQLLKVCDDYAKRYSAQHSSRQFNWLWAYSKATVQLKFPKSKGRYAQIGYTLVLNSYQVSILNLFTDPSLYDGGVVLSPQQICANIDIDADLAASELVTLTNARILQYTPDKTGICINQTFDSKQRYIDLSRIKPAQHKKEEATMDNRDMAFRGNTEPPSVDAASTYMLQYGRFEAMHQQQLEALGLPRSLWKQLYDKITGETFDIGEWVVFSDDDTVKSLAEHTLSLKSEKLEAESKVFLVDHIWTTTVARELQDLDSVPGLLERMEKLTGIYEPQKNLPAMPDTDLLENTVDANVAAVMSQAGVDEARAQELLRKAGGDIIEAIVAASEETAPSTAQSSVQSQIMQQLEEGGQGDGPTEWKTRGYECVQYSLDNSAQLDGVDICVAVGAAVHARDVVCNVTATHLTVTVSGKVAVDGALHAEVEANETTWTVEAGVLSVSLVKRKAEYWPEVLVGEHRTDPITHAKHVRRVARDTWRYLQGYDYLARSSDQTLAKRTFWYVADAVGLAVAHDDEPNVRCLPLLYVDAQGQMTPLSILWPIRDIAQGTTLVRDVCPAWLTDPQQRQGYLHAIFSGPTQFVLDSHEQLARMWDQTAKNAVRADIATGPTPKLSGRSLFVRDITSDAKAAVAAAGLVLVDAPKDADIVFDDVPCEGRLTNQHSLNAAVYSTENAITAFQRIAGAQSWLSPGFLLKSQICELIGAAIMRNNSWWLLKSDQVVAGVEPQTVLTSNWITAVRHADVGYSAALECTPSM
ncbi:ubiquitin ligase (cullin) of SCF, partial [Coemansia sp. RSA 2131]